MVSRLKEDSMSKSCKKQVSLTYTEQSQQGERGSGRVSLMLRYVGLMARLVGWIAEILSKPYITSLP